MSAALRRPACLQDLYEFYLRTYCEQVSPPPLVEQPEFEARFDAWCRFSGVPADARGQGLAFVFGNMGPFSDEREG